MTTRMAGQRLQEDDPVTKESRDSVNEAIDPSKGSDGRSSDPENYKAGGIYNSGGGGLKRPEPAYTGPTTATDRTLSGYYAVDNSTEANLARTKKYSDFNAETQNKWKESYDQEAIDGARANNPVSIKALDNRVGEREMYNRAKGDVYQSQIFGDIWKDSNSYIDKDRTPASWQSAQPARPVKQPDFQDMYEKYSNFD